ncbi:hypothetical protein M514_03828, partial [Trichuris suis]
MGSFLAEFQKHSSHASQMELNRDPCESNEQQCSCTEEMVPSTKQVLRSSMETARCHSADSQTFEMSPTVHPSTVRTLKRDVACQTVYSFPVDFDFFFIFSHPAFLNITDDNDEKLLASMKRDSSSTTSELITQFYSNLRLSSKHYTPSESNDSSSVREKESFEHSNVCTQNKTLPSCALNVTDNVEESSAMNVQTSESSWLTSSNDCNLSVSYSLYNSQDRNNFEEMLAIHGVVLSPIEPKHKVGNTNKAETVNKMTSHLGRDSTGRHLESSANQKDESFPAEIDLATTRHHLSSNVDESGTF